MADGGHDTVNAARPFRLPVRGFAEVTALLWVYVVYSGLRNFVTGSPAVAANHAAEILRFDRAVGIDAYGLLNPKTSKWFGSGTAAPGSGA